MGYIMDLRKTVGSRPLIMGGACIILFDKHEQILLQQRTDNGLWGLPGGSLEPGESLEEAARREMYEETGLNAGSIQLLDIFSGKEFYYQYPNGDEVYNVIAAYTCHEYNGNLRIDEEEVKDLKFFNIQDLPREINPMYLPIIDTYKQNNSNFTR